MTKDEFLALAADQIEKLFEKDSTVDFTYVMVKIEWVNEESMPERMTEEDAANTKLLASQLVN